MNMDIQSIGAAATVALLCAIVFVFAAKSWTLISRVLAGHPSFADSIMSEAAQRFRNELDALSRRQSTYLGAGLVFVVMYTAAVVFQPPALFDGYPRWQLYALFFALGSAAVFAAWRLLRAITAWRHVRLAHDANIAVGHQLQSIASGHGRAFHDVPTAAGVADHVLTGVSGVYVISVVARRSLRKGHVSIDGNDLIFSNSQERQSIVNATAAGKRLAKELTRLTGIGIRVRSVIAVPGWDISENLSREHLLVNERTLPMLRAWKDESDYLMDEDLKAIQDELVRRCTRRGLRSNGTA